MSICERFVNFLENVQNVDTRKKAFSLCSGFSSGSQGFGHHSTSRRALLIKEPLRSLPASHWMDGPDIAGGLLSRAYALSVSSRGLNTFRLSKACEIGEDRRRMVEERRPVRPSPLRPSIPPILHLFLYSTDLHPPSPQFAPTTISFPISVVIRHWGSATCGSSGQLRVRFTKTPPQSIDFMAAIASS